MKANILYILTVISFIIAIRGGSGQIILSALEGNVMSASGFLISGSILLTGAFIIDSLQNIYKLLEENYSNKRPKADEEKKDNTPYYG